MEIGHLIIVDSSNLTNSSTLKRETSIKRIRGGNSSHFISYHFLKGADPGFGQGGDPGSEAESCRRSKVESHKRSEQFAASVQGPLKGAGSFWVFNAQICILPHSRDSFSLNFDIYFNTKSS